MRAVRLHAFGGPERLRFEEVPDPRPGPGRVRIAVEAAGVHPVDTALRRGDADRVPLPYVPGGEVAGRVDAVGPGVPADWLGVRVVTRLGLVGGGYASLVVREAAAVHRVPDGVGFPAAVAAVGAGAAALAALDAAAPEPDDVVLVTGAAGAVGHLVVQGAAGVGAHVVGVVGHADKRSAVLRAGAAVAVDHRHPDWADRVRAALCGREVDVVVDGVGGVLGRTAVELLCGGRVVLSGASSGTPTLLSTVDIVGRGLTVAAVRRGSVRTGEARALAAVAAGRLRPVVRVFPLSRAGSAHEAVEERTVVGKVVLVPGPAE
ncbi:zinc-binding dehydrogenase [Saccharothrix violaceirubra]|uniref:NADPH2:quinone reductase n=1 Tax=Saccharothrix violaceirubra TaxID=413306 RepID=A0A7W7WY77_9PSEU|nr:zinc-binding dehydrogenase [Saccharothrix violaceirubra]MBB4968150.1 NADPH2:quinone reductase [Saccharothrix violaceirubra]